MSEEDVKDAEEEEEVLEEEAGEDNSDLEARARRMGWVPKEEFRGPESIWKDANTYIEHGESELPVLRERFRKQDAELAKLQAMVKEFPGKLSRIEKQMHERVVRELKEKQRAAVETGDVETYDRIELEAKQAQEAIKESVKAPEEKDQKKIVSSWESQNSWFNKDDDLTAYAIGLHQRTWNGDPDTLEENLQTVTETIKEKFPEKFENPNRKRPAAVEAGATTVKTKGKKSYNDLPPEAREECDFFIRNKTLTKEQYVKEYFGEQA